MSNVFLPQEIITEILTRLPVKSLMKFKCVSSPEFVNYHLEISSSSPKILLSFRRPISYACSAANLLISEPMFYPVEKQNQYVWVQCCCKGLVCFVTVSDCVSRRRDVFLWNPCTRKSQQLPQVNFGRDNRNFTYSMAYDESNGDYYVVAMSAMELHIFSLKNNSWKSKDSLTYLLYGDCKFVAGKFNVMRMKMDNYKVLFREPGDIVSSDFGDEDYGVIELPNCGKDAEQVSLEVVGGCISLLCRMKFYASDLWVMKEYGVTRSWTKLFTLWHEKPPKTPCIIKPLVMLSSEEILLLVDQKLVVHNLKYSNDTRSLETRNLGWVRGAHVYVESLVSPTRCEIIGRQETTQERTS